MHIFNQFKKHISQLIKKYIYSNELIKKEKTSESIEENYIPVPFVYPYHHLEYFQKLITNDNHLHQNTEQPIFDLEQFNTFYQQTISQEKITPEKQSIINRIWLDSYYIHRTLEPLIKLGIIYNSDLVGGCIRDLLLGKEQEIKDLDICIYINLDNTLMQKNSLHGNRESTSEAFIKEVSTLFTEDELSSINLLTTDNALESINKVIVLCMNRTQDIDSAKLFTENERFLHLPEQQYGPDVLNLLTALIKTGNKNTYFPIDLIVTDTVRYSFVSNIDFNLCKIGCCLTHSMDGFYKPQFHFPSEPRVLMDRIYSEFGFWTDAYQKKLTFDLSNKTEQQILFSLDKRLSRLSEKYSDYLVNINNMSSKLYPFAKSALFKNTLQTSLEQPNSKEQNIKKNKI